MKLTEKDARRLIITQPGLDVGNSFIPKGEINTYRVNEDYTLENVHREGITITDVSSVFSLVKEYDKVINPYEEYFSVEEYLHNDFELHNGKAVYAKANWDSEPVRRHYRGVGNNAFQCWQSGRTSFTAYDADDYSNYLYIKLAKTKRMKPKEAEATDE